MAVITHQAAFSNSLQLRHNEYCQTEIISRNKMCKEQIIIITVVQRLDTKLRVAGAAREIVKPLQSAVVER
jgi:hypothetical protein